MIVLTETQSQSLRLPGATPARAVDPGTQETFVVLRLEEYERLTGEAYDASPWTDEERDQMRAEAIESLGWDGMDAYQDQQQ